jgi:hypothetical protein
MKALRKRPSFAEAFSVKYMKTWRNVMPYMLIGASAGVRREGSKESAHGRHEDPDEERAQRGVKNSGHCERCEGSRDVW